MAEQGPRQIKVDQLTGPGVPGLEEDPPLYHFDIDVDEMEELSADPAGFLQRLGLGPDKGIAPTGNVQLITHPGMRWSGREWMRRDAAEEARLPAKPKACCYVSDDSMICHTH